MMAGVVDGVLAVGMERPYAFGDEFGLGLRRPIADFFLFTAVFALHFLQKQQIGVGGDQGVADLMQHEAPISHVEAFMNVVGKYPKRIVLHLVNKGGGEYAIYTTTANRILLIRKTR